MVRLVSTNQWTPAMPTHSSLTPLPIIGTDRGGKRFYDPQAKRALILPALNRASPERARRWRMASVATCFGNESSSINGECPAKPT